MTEKPRQEYDAGPGARVPPKLDDAVAVERDRVLRLLDGMILENITRIGDEERERLARLRVAIELGKSPIKWPMA